MKTPEQIADEWANYMFIGDSPNAKRAIELAINADRAQRAETFTPRDVIITAEGGKVRTGAFTPLDAHGVIERYLDDGYALEDLDWEVRP